MKWKVAIVGPDGVVHTNTAFGLIYSFPTRDVDGLNQQSVAFGMWGIRDEPVRMMTINPEFDDKN